MAIRANLKLSSWFYGHSNSPKVGQVAYKLDFPPQSRLHVFHVSFLKPKLGANILLLLTLPLVDSKYSLYPEPQAILQSRVKKNSTIDFN